MKFKDETEARKYAESRGDCEVVELPDASGWTLRYIEPKFDPDKRLSYIVQVLKTGWGWFLIGTGLLSLIIDICSPWLYVTAKNGKSISLTPEGSAFLGWIALVLIIDIPPAVFRTFHRKAIARWIAFFWCAGTVFTVLILKELADPNPPNKGGYLGIFAATVVAWRLLTWKDEDFTKTNKPEA
jgi:hypothetical protein